MLDRTLVAVVSAVLLVALTLGMVGMLAPFLRRAEFDLLCREALFRMDALGGLPEADQSDLAASLGAAGFGDISIDATEGAPFGAPLVLEVRATTWMRRISGWEVNTGEVATLWFRKETVCRRISTYDGEVR
jgi:hypothetical protein